MLIVEGPDGSGKTRLAKQIAETFDLEYRRAPSLSSTDGPDLEVYDWWRHEIALGGNRVVYDRCFFISEFIYQLPSHGRELMVTHRELTMGLWDLWLKDAHFIFCLPSWEVSRTIISAQGRGALKGVDVSDLEKIHWGYHWIYTMLYIACPTGMVIKHDFTDRGHEQQTLDWVRNGYLKHRMRRH